MGITNRAARKKREENERDKMREDKIRVWRLQRNTFACKKETSARVSLTRFHGCDLFPASLGRWTPSNECFKAMWAKPLKEARK
jgi:hypothetical protein